MKRRVILSFIMLWFLSAGSAATGDSDSSISSKPESVDSTGQNNTPAEVSLVYIVTIDGAISAVVDDRIAEAIGQAQANGAELLVIRLDTPGGYTGVTWSICKRILNSDVPVCTYISPSGARAGSAGVYITYASQIAAMAPSTNIGAAHPVSGGGEKIDSIMNEKITNDAVAQIRAAAERYGRNAEWAENAVRKSVSITNTEALKLNVIDLVAKDLHDLFAQLDGREVSLAAGNRTLRLSEVYTEEIAASWAQQVLAVITNPNIVFILFSIGGLGILLELYHPGAIFPGVVGAISLIIAFYASQTLPINYAGVALIFLALILWVAEAKIVSHGLLTIGGMISFFLGGLMLVDTVDPELRVSFSLLISITVIVTLIVVAVLYLVIKAQRHRPFSGNEGMIGKTAEMRADGMIYVEGALWKVDADEEIKPGDNVVITGVDGLHLKVRKTDTI